MGGTRLCRDVWFDDVVSRIPFGLGDDLTQDGTSGHVDWQTDGVRVGSKMVKVCP